MQGFTRSSDQADPGISRIPLLFRGLCNCGCVERLGGLGRYPASNLGDLCWICLRMLFKSRQISDRRRHEANGRFKGRSGRRIAGINVSTGHGAEYLEILSFGQRVIWGPNVEVCPKLSPWTESHRLNYSLPLIKGQKWITCQLHKWKWSLANVTDPCPLQKLQDWHGPR